MKKALLIIFVLAVAAIIGYVIYQNNESDMGYIDDIPEPVYTQDCFPRTLLNQGVTKECFEGANFRDNSKCSEKELKLIQDYYKKGQENDPLNDGSGNFCAD